MPDIDDLEKRIKKMKFWIKVHNWDLFIRIVIYFILFISIIAILQKIYL